MSARFHHGSPVGTVSLAGPPILQVADPDDAGPAEDCPWGESVPEGGDPRVDELSSDRRVGAEDNQAGQDGAVLVVEPGRVLFDHYLVRKRLGEGTMGVVWLVKDLRYGTLRALKLMGSGTSVNPVAMARFKREARTMSRVWHPHVVGVRDARVDGSAAYIDMEYVRGRTLRKRMRGGEPMPIDFVLRLLEQLCSVLDLAHWHGIVHRDLKPENLMLLDGRPPGREVLKVGDFGLAKTLKSDGETLIALTHQGDFLGSPAYSGPEQASGGHVDARTDLYSVGVLLHELLTGERPFQGSIVEVVHGHLYSPPPPFSRCKHRLELPTAVEGVVRGCLAKDPADRPQSARALFDDFRRAAGDDDPRDGPRWKVEILRNGRRWAHRGLGADGGTIELFDGRLRLKPRCHLMLMMVDSGLAVATLDHGQAIPVPSQSLLGPEGGTLSVAGCTVRVYLDPDDSPREGGR